jgi:hypothetical protein
MSDWEKQVGVSDRDGTVELEFTDRTSISDLPTNSSSANRSRIVPEPYITFTLNINA